MPAAPPEPPPPYAPAPPPPPATSSLGSLGPPAAGQLLSEIEHVRTSDSPPPPVANPLPAGPPPIATSTNRFELGVTLRSDVTWAPGPPRPLNALSPAPPLATTCTLLTPAGTANVPSAPIEEYVQVTVAPDWLQLDGSAAAEPANTTPESPSRPAV